MRRMYLMLVAVSLVVCGVALYAAPNASPAFFQRLSQTVSGRALLNGPDAPDDGNAPRSDSLSQKEVLRRISRIYQYQSDALAAAAAGRQEAMEPLLLQSFADLQDLSRQPGILEDRRFRELFRTVVTEYEKYFGLPADTLAVERGDVFELRDTVFAALNELRDPLLEDINLPSLRPVGTTIPMTTNRLVEQSIRYLVQNPDRHLNTWLSRADTYFSMIEQVLKEEEMPDELKYLALIESGLNPRARSWAQAVGMWQFLAATGREQGLRVDGWVDERMDPEASTRAAARYVRSLHKQFGDWHLALAAYNCGAGNVRKAIRRLGGPRERATFWAIYPYLPRETRNYVPMYIAASLVASNPEAFGVRPVEAGPLYAYDTVPVQPATPLATVARLAGTDVDALRALNPALRRASLPPGKEPYRVRIPHGSHEQFTERYAAHTGIAVDRMKEHVVRRGDTPKNLARRYGITPDLLLATNGLEAGRVTVGQRLSIPIKMRPREREQQATALAAHRPERVYYGPRVHRPIAPGAGALATAQRTHGPRPDAPAPSASRALAETRPTPAPQRNVEAAPVRQASSRITHRVRRGETLGRIARRYGVSVASLRQWNGLRGNFIRSGAELKVYPGQRAAKASQRSTARASKATYRVRRGDTLHQIGRRHNVSVASLKRWNGLRSSRIRPGQRLLIYR